MPPLFSQDSTASFCPGQDNPVHITKLYFSKIHVNIILLLLLSSLSGSLLFLELPKNILYAFLIKPKAYQFNKSDHFYSPDSHTLIIYDKSTN